MKTTFAILSLCIIAASAPLRNPGETNYVPQLQITSAGHLILRAPVGSTNRIEFVSELTATNWQTLTNLAVQQSPIDIIDASFTQASRRFFRVVPATAAVSSSRTEADGGAYRGAKQRESLPIAWQLKYFGHTGVDPNADPDGDGWTNLQEFQNGTNPTRVDQPLKVLITRPSWAHSHKSP